jgi:hypothetical protein
MAWTKLTLACVLTAIFSAGDAMEPKSAAQASTLVGDVISGSYAYPCDTCTYTGNFSYFTNPFVVGTGSTIETALFIGNPVYYSAWDVSFNANSVTLTMASAPLTDASYSSDPFNGPVFTVLAGNSFGSITGMVVNNPDCIPCNPITAYLSGNSLFINWEGAGGQVGDTITIDFSVGGPLPSTTPLPAALPLFAAGLGALGLLAKSRKRKAAAPGSRLIDEPSDRRA